MKDSALEQITALNALSPLDGRYAGRLASLRQCFSEAALIKFRVQVEVAWFMTLARSEHIPELRSLTEAETQFLQQIIDTFDDEDVLAVKRIEQTTNHDVKAVEYFFKEALQSTSLAPLQEFVHFGCTSEDINNLAHALMLKQGITEIWLKQAEAVVAALDEFGNRHQNIPMLAHTHGQPASPTTVGKEMAVYSFRLKRQLQQIRAQTYLGKMNGAVGNFNAHFIAYPHVNWPDLARNFVEEGLGLTYNPLTTQIESHDYMAELFQAIHRFNSIIIDLDCDVWLYISKGYFKEKIKGDEVGSSTMPHKVNPIDFENSEGNMGLANALLEFLSRKLPVSRLQRDLTDSTVIRNMGVAIGHSTLALQSTLRGINKLSVDQAKLAADLSENWEILSEAIQTVMRKARLENPYEQLKALTRGHSVTAAELTEFVQQLSISAEDKERLLALTPATYLGNAAYINGNA